MGLILNKLDHTLTKTLLWVSFYSIARSSCDANYSLLSVPFEPWNAPRATDWLLCSVMLQCIVWCHPLLPLEPATTSHAASRGSSELATESESGTGSPDCTWIVPMTATSKSLVGPLFWTHTRVEGVKRLADWKQLKGTGLLGFETKKVFECQKEQLKKKRKKSWRMEKKSPVDLISNLFCFCFCFVC